MFPVELERDAFRAGNGEYGWTHAQVPLVIDILRGRGLGILGGELWWVRPGGTAWELPPSGVYVWDTERHPGESWGDFVERGASEALAAVQRCHEAEGIRADQLGRLLYNFTWVSEEEFERLDANPP
jgi:hypothetical protein